MGSFFYRKLIKNSFTKSTTAIKNVDNIHVRELFADDFERVQPLDNVQQVKLDTFESISSHEIGGEWLCTQAIKELGLDTYLVDQLGWNFNETSVGMLGLLGRLLYPDSEKKTAEWLNENSAAMELFCPESGTVDRNRLMQCAKKIYQDKDKIENHLSGKIESIFKIENKLILYDLTNTHFEGIMKKCPKAKYGRNKQKRSDCRQITLGLLADQDGFIKHSRCYPGNISEPNTFMDVLTELDSCKNGIERPVIVMDAGIATENNLKMSLSKEIDYLCVSRSEHKDLLEKVDKENLVCFVNKSGEEVKTQFFYQDIEYIIGDEKFTRQETIMYVETPAKEAKERGMFGKKQQGFETGLDLIKKSVNKCWTEIVRIMNTQKCNLNSIINKKGEKILLKTCTRPQMKANEIYQAMKYKPMPFHRKLTILNVG